MQWQYCTYIFHMVRSSCLVSQLLLLSTDTFCLLELAIACDAFAVLRTFKWYVVIGTWHHCAVETPCAVHQGTWGHACFCAPTYTVQSSLPMLLLTGVSHIVLLQDGAAAAALAAAAAAAAQAISGPQQHHPPTSTVMLVPDMTAGGTGTDMGGMHQ